MKTIATRIAHARKALNLNQSELARLLDLTPQAVQSWESGKAMPKGTRLQKLARVLGKSVEWLVGDPTDPAEQEIAQNQKQLSKAFVQDIVKMTDEQYPDPKEAREARAAIAGYLIEQERMEELQIMLADSIKALLTNPELYERIFNAGLLEDVYRILRAASDGEMSPTDQSDLHAIAVRFSSVKKD